MAKLNVELWNTLQELTDEEFKNFKWFLKHDDFLEGFSGIPVAQLEKAERQDAVDLMVQKYQGHGALKITLKVLEEINRNDLVQRLRLKDLNSHGSVLLKQDYERKKAKLDETKSEINLMIEERQKKITEIKRSAELSSRTADRQVADSERVYAVLLESVKQSLADLIQLINEQQKTAQKQAEGYIQELGQEISKLTKRRTEVEKLARTENYLDFPQSFACLNAIPATKNWTKVTLLPPSYGRFVGASVNQLKENLRKETEMLITKAKLNRVQQFAVDVTLDPDTANPFLTLSDDGKQVYFGAVKQNLPDNPERFNTAGNVLGKQSFSSGRFYYEVQVKGKTSWDLGVTKESIVRKGSIKPSPENGYWTICLRNGDKYKASSGVYLKVKDQPKKVGVFVDYDKDMITFFDVDSADIIHTLTNCSFNEKLYPFFSPGLNHGTYSTPLIISPVKDTDYI